MSSIRIIQGIIPFDSINVDQDNEDLENAVTAAKYGNWTTCLAIINRKPYLINCIPGTRSWAILHQAVYWNNIEVTRQLLDIDTCDALVKTRECRAHDAAVGSTPVKVAVSLGNRKEVQDIIQKHCDNERNNRFEYKTPHQISGKEGEKIADHLPLFYKAVVMFKRSLLSPHSCPDDHLKNLLEEIMKEMKEETTDWTDVRKQLYRSLYPIDRGMADAIVITGTQEQMFIKIIEIYTMNHYYRTINHAIAKDFGTKIVPDAEDLAIALYDLMLDAVLFCWKDNRLNPNTSETYRGIDVKIPKEDKPLFQSRKKIMFTHFVSSSKQCSVAKERFARDRKTGKYGTIFVIKSAEDSHYRPKYVEHFTAVTGEYECIFPVGAEFVVTEVDEENPPNGDRPDKISLKLVN